MLGLWSAYNRTFLLVIMVATTLVYALPIFFVPLLWARAFRWRIPQDSDLTVYFGRCLGAFVLILEALVLRAGLTGKGLVFTFQILIAVGVLMTLVHTWGALRRIQPLTETLEIGMYSGLTILALLFYPSS